MNVPPETTDEFIQACDEFAKTNPNDNFRKKTIPPANHWPLLKEKFEVDIPDYPQLSHFSYIPEITMK